jgi:hypothetical protein
MSLLDKLRSIEHFPASHQPATGELLSVVGALVALAEHGDELFEAVERDIKAREAGEPAVHVDQLVSGVEPEPEPEPEPSVPAPAAATPPPAAADVESDQQRVDRLRQELQTAEAQLDRTQTTVEPGAETPPAPPADPLSPAPPADPLAPAPPADPLSPAPPAAAPTTNPEGV